MSAVAVAYSTFCTCPSPKLDANSKCRCGTQWVEKKEEFVYVAEFPRVAEAQAFTAHVAGPGWSMVPGSLKQTGRKVTWRSHKPPSQPGRSYYEGYEWSMLETVGYFGSAPSGRKAKLNGRTAPASY